MTNPKVEKIVYIPCTGVGVSVRQKTAKDSKAVIRRYACHRGVDKSHWWAMSLLVTELSYEYTSVCGVRLRKASQVSHRHTPAVFIDRSHAPSSCETLSAFFPTLVSANRRADSPIGRGAGRWLDNTPAGCQSRAAQSALEGQTTKRRVQSVWLWSDKGNWGNALAVCYQLLPFFIDLPNMREREKKTFMPLF